LPDPPLSRWRYRKSAVGDPCKFGQWNWTGRECLSVVKGDSTRLSRLTRDGIGIGDIGLHLGVFSRCCWDLFAMQPIQRVDLPAWNGERAKGSILCRWLDIWYRHTVMFKLRGHRRGPWPRELLTRMQASRMRCVLLGRSHPFPGRHRAVTTQGR